MGIKTVETVQIISIFWGNPRINSGVKLKNKISKTVLTVYYLARKLYTKNRA